MNDNDILQDETCFSVHQKYNVDCQRQTCKHWIASAKDSHNCAVLEARKGSRTLKEVGEFFGLSRMRICQIEKKICNKMRLPILETEK